MKSAHEPARSRIRLVMPHDPIMRGRLRWLPVIAIPVLLVAACTPTVSTPGSVTPSPPPSKTGVPTSPQVRPGELFCADAYTTEARGAKPEFSASGVGFEVLNEVGFDPIPAAGAGLPAEATGYLSKSPIYLDEGVTWAEVTAITGDIRFAWEPARVWTKSGWSLAYEAASARFESCNGSYTGFLGAVRTPTAHACITLGVRSNLHPAVEPKRVAIGKGSCP